MGRVIYTIVELSEVVKESNLILEVECLKAFSEDVVVKGIDPNPPFIKKGFDFKVTKVLKNDQKITVPDTIRVPNENWRRRMGEYKHTHGDGPSKTYGVKQYETEVTSFGKADILFLHHFQGTFELECYDSFESLEGMEKVTMLIASDTSWKK